MKIDEITRQSLLYDFYGALLPQRQMEVMELYHEENLSLAEIADEFGISRQGVHDALHKAERALENYEDKLGLVKKFSETSDAIAKIDKSIATLLTINAKAVKAEKTVTELKKIKKIIDSIEA